MLGNDQGRDGCFISPGANLQAFSPLRNTSHLHVSNLGRYQENTGSVVQLCFARWTDWGRLAPISASSIT